jgi:hypothetical protein
MTTQHFHDFTEFEAFARKQPLGTQYHVFKVAPDGIGVKIYEADQGKANQDWTAAAFAQAVLGDPSMECHPTGVTEFGSITGTVVPRFP